MDRAEISVSKFQTLKQGGRHRLEARRELDELAACRTVDEVYVETLTITEMGDKAVSFEVEGSLGPVLENYRKSGFYISCNMKQSGSKRVSGPLPCTRRQNYRRDLSLIESGVSLTDRTFNQQREG